MFSADNREKKFLLEVARQSLHAAVEGRHFVAEFSEITAVRSSGGAFVSLHRRGRLRGCVGQIMSSDSLVATVAYCARAAALEDPRFDPVRPQELKEIEIELSVLSQLQPIEPGQIEAGKHGLMVSSGWKRGVLLPQVALQFRWDGQRLLEETCVKAGLNRDAWKLPETRIQAFTAEIFNEKELANELNYSSST